jgi:hypothetical protein
VGGWWEVGFERRTLFSHLYLSATCPFVLIYVSGVPRHVTSNQFSAAKTSRTDYQRNSIRQT